MHKDKKAMNILYNDLYKDMFDNIINCMTSNEVWDTLKTLYEDTEHAKKNKMQLPIQNYEAFHFNGGQPINDTYSKFQQFLNGLKLYERIYFTKDTNWNFQRSLSKEWKLVKLSLRYSHEFKEHTLENLCGILKTYQLEI